MRDRYLDRLECCPLCGGELVEWHTGIEECQECMGMFDMGEFYDRLSGEDDFDSWFDNEFKEEEK